MSYDYRQAQPSRALINLDHRAWPVVGPVRRRSVTPMPPKMTVGEHTRDDNVVMSSYIVGNFAGGMGIESARSGTDLDRYHIGNLETLYRWPTLGPLVTKFGSTVNAAVDHFCSYGGTLWAFLITSGTTTTSYSWTNTSSDFASGGTLSGTVRASAWHDGKLYVLTSVNLYWRNGGSWTALTTPIPGYGLVSHDGKLYILTDANDLKWHLDPSLNTAWSADGNPYLDLPAGWCRQLITYYDQTGVRQLHAVTSVGLYGYDPDLARFEATSCSHPYFATAGRNACEWQGALYLPVGGSVWKYVAAGPLVQAMGPDKDEGPPSHLQGDVVAVVAGHAHLFCVTDASTPTATTLVDPFDSAMVPGETVLAAASHNGAVYRTTSASWHMLPHPQVGDGIYDVPPVGMGASIVAGIDTTLRFWYSCNTGVYYLDLPKGLHNPLTNPQAETSAIGYLITPWQDFGWAEIPKVALSYDLFLADFTADCSLKLYVGYDYSPNWELLVETSDNGEVMGRIGGVEGREFHAIRLLVVLKRGTDTTVHPLIKSIEIGYMRVPQSLEGWDLTLDLTTAGMEGLPASPGAMIDILFRLKRQRRGLLFTYRGDDQTPTTRRVWLYEVVAAEEPGITMGGRYNVNLIELDDQEHDAELAVDSYGETI